MHTPYIIYVDGAVSRARALFDYDAGDETELSFRAGDIIAVLQKDPSGMHTHPHTNRTAMRPYAHTHTHALTPQCPCGFILNTSSFF